MTGTTRKNCRVGTERPAAILTKHNKNAANYKLEEREDREEAVAKIISQDSLREETFVEIISPSAPSPTQWERNTSTSFQIISGLPQKTGSEEMETFYCP